jgi:ATPase family associated with various cellular activities (AAA)
MLTAPRPEPSLEAARSTADASLAIEIALLANVPLALWGAPGTGKTSLVRSVAQKLGWPMYTTTATIYEPTDFSGLPFLSGGTITAHTMRAPLEWAVTLAAEALKQGGNGLVFFDDVAFAPLTVQHALLQIVLERRVDQFQLPIGVRCAVALDPGAKISRTPLLTAPLANRMVHVGWTPDASSWIEGFLSDWFRDLPTLPRDWELRLPAARTKIAAFIRSRPELLNNAPKDRDAQSGPWPSARTWDMFSRLLAACDAADVRAEVRLLLTAGAVGKEAGIEYLNWEREADLPDPEAL